MNKKILDRINKLIALGSSPEQGESDTALSMAESLMKEYGVSYSELNYARIEEELGEIGEERFAEEGFLSVGGRSRHGGSKPF